MTWSSTFSNTALFAGSSDVVARAITVKSGATVTTVSGGAALTVLPRGTVLGRITATDKYIPSVSGASDGSQVPSCVLAADTDPSGGDAVTEAYFHGEFAVQQMSFDYGWTSATLQAAFRTNNIAIFARDIGVLG
jgi:hypothetical protein